MLELSLHTSSTTFVTGVQLRYLLGCSLLVENINSTSLLEIQDNNNISGSAFKNLSE